ncbi:MAG TPA: TM2 domain-containing protein [Saprospiraceae bacterium]|nr:TM2 domain-containing protein [Saprospiraceae bacterium]
MKFKYFFLLLAFVTFQITSFASFPVVKKDSIENNIYHEDYNGKSKTKNSQIQLNDKEFESLTSPAAGSEKSQVIALLLVLFVGVLGIHRFYLGYTWQGVVQLLTAGGCGIWALVDLIRIVTGDLKPKNGDYKDKL